jgi:hypothetical protein
VSTASFSSVFPSRLQPHLYLVTSSLARLQSSPPPNTTPATSTFRKHHGQGLLRASLVLRKNAPLAPVLEFDTNHEAARLQRRASELPPCHRLPHVRAQILRRLPNCQDGIQVPLRAGWPLCFYRRLHRRPQHDHSRRRFRRERRRLSKPDCRYCRLLHSFGGHLLLLGATGFGLERGYLSLEGLGVFGSLALLSALEGGSRRFCIVSGFLDIMEHSTLAL